MVEETEGTLIPVKRTTADRLKTVGTMHDTYDIVINRALDLLEKKK